MKADSRLNHEQQARATSPVATFFSFLLVFLLIIYAYLPTLQYDFVTGDQWRVFQYSMLDASSSTKAVGCYHRRLYFDIRTGRPLCSIGECLEHALVGEISDFSTTRPIVLCLVIITAFGLGLVFSPVFGGYKNGLIIGALAVFSPGYAFMYYRGMSCIMHLSSLVFAVFSYLFLRQAVKNNFNKYKLLLLSSLFFLVACMIYPAWAFAVFIFLLIDFFWGNESDRHIRLKHVVTGIIFYAGLSIIYYIVIKVLISFTPYIATVDTNKAYAFVANFNPLYLVTRFTRAAAFFLSQPPVNALSGASINGLLIVFSVLYAVRFFLINKYRFFDSFMAVLITAGSLLIAIAPWLLSSMNVTGNRYFLPFSLLMCVLTGWVVFLTASKFFPNRKYIPTIMLFGVLLIPASVIQNKRAFFEVDISQKEIETMRSVLHRWIDKDLFETQRYIVVVRPDRLMPAAYEKILGGVNYGDCFGLPYDSLHYFYMFIALLREKCDRQHPLGREMKIYYSPLPCDQATEQLLDQNPQNIVFTVVNQGAQITTKHKIVEINFSLITSSPEPLIVNREDSS